MNFHALALLLPPLAGGEPPCTLMPTEVTADLLTGEVAMWGTTAAVASEPRVLLVFTYSDGRWGQRTVVATSNLPHAIAVYGDTIVVGQPSNDELGTDSGVVEVFVGSGSSWSLEARLFPDAPEPHDFFGSGIAIEGDLLLVGARGRGTGGSVLVYERSGSAWSKVDELEPDVPIADGGFGGDVALSEGTAVVTELAGDAYAFVQDGRAWTQEAKLDLPVESLTFLGVRAAVSGDLAAFAHSDFGVSMFARTGSAWAHEATFADLNNPHNSVVAMSGDVVVSGARDLDVYVRGGTTWSHLATEPGFAGGVAVQGNGMLAASGVFFIDHPGTLGAYQLPVFLAPSVEHRNAAANPDSYTASPAYIGHGLGLTVDLTTTGHDMALVVGFDSPVELTLGGGQTLLAFDLGGGGPLIDTGFHPGPNAEIDIPIPNDLAFAAVPFYTQAIHAFGVVPFALSNAQDVRIGVCL